MNDFNFSDFRMEDVVNYIQTKFYESALIEEEITKLEEKLKQDEEKQMIETKQLVGNIPMDQFMKAMKERQYKRDIGMGCYMSLHVKHLNLMKEIMSFLDELIDTITDGGNTDIPPHISDMIESLRQTVSDFENRTKSHIEHIQNNSVKLNNYIDAILVMTSKEEK